MTFAEPRQFEELAAGNGHISIVPAELVSEETKQLLPGTVTRKGSQNCSATLNKTQIRALDEHAEHNLRFSELAQIAAQHELA